MGFLDKLFRVTDNTVLKEKICQGAQLLDVRTEEEFEAGHARGAVHIPLSLLPKKYETMQPNSPVVVVCESGARSAQAVRFLISRGFEAYNGGSWRSFS